MIYKCEDCVNRNHCPENKNQYQALSKVIESVLRLDREPEFNCYFNCYLKCNYFVPDNDSKQKEICTQGKETN